MPSFVVLCPPTGCDVDVVTEVWVFFDHLDKANTLGWQSLSPISRSCSINIGLRVVKKRDSISVLFKSSYLGVYIIVF